MFKSDTLSFVLSREWFGNNGLGRFCASYSQELDGFGWVWVMAMQMRLFSGVLLDQFLRVKLPIDEIAEEMVRVVGSGSAAVRVLLRAPTGSGKSTVVPGLVADALVSGMVVVVEPRRMAARLLAGWVARQRGAVLGREIGYAVRFDSRYARDSRVVFVTDGVFQRWLHEDPSLSGVVAVIFDEFHERRLAVDVALGRCLDLQEGARPDLRVVVMSATLETSGLAEFLAPAVLLEAGGRTFPVEVFHRSAEAGARDRRGGPAREAPVWERMVAVCRDAVALEDAGDVLMFLPGAHEIRRTVALLEQSGFSRSHEIHSLHGAMPPEAQERAIRPAAKPKIIVSTNVAETSLTIEGVRTVIDSGLARVAAFDARRGINTLHIRPISRAAADQRAGRAGRTAPGRAFRLWSQAGHARREAFETPEVHRVDLAECVLLLKAAGVSEPEGFRWLDAPDATTLARANSLLHDLGALDSCGGITAEGRRMAALPLDPRFARLLLAGCDHGCAAEAAFIAASVEGEELFVGGKSAGRREDFAQPDDRTDFAADWRAFDAAHGVGFDVRRCDGFGVSARAARETARSFERLASIVRRAAGTWETPDFTLRGREVARAMLAAFSDHLAIRLNQGTLACRMVGARRGRLDEASCAKSAVAFVAAEITEVQGREVVTHLRRATAIDPAWLDEMFPDDFSRTDGVAWDECRRRVVRRREAKFRDLVITCDESDHDCNHDAAAEMLARHVVADSLNLKNWNHDVDQWTARLSNLAVWMPELGMPGWGDDDRAAAIAQICHGALAYKQVKDAAVWPVLREWLNPAQREALDHYCPERLALPGGRTARITYETGKPPSFAARVADLFGMWSTPAVAGGRVPLLVHILTPGQKPWQVTRDLESFWKNGYPQMRRELAGRYPRHPWPEDPKAHDPPARRN